MGPGGHEITPPTGGMPMCPKTHVQPCTPETCPTPCPRGDIQVVPCDSMQPGSAWARVGMGVQGIGCFARDVPVQTWQGMCSARPGS